MYDPDWQEKYKDKIVSAEEAVSKIRPGARVFIGTGCAEPQSLVRALYERRHKLPGVEIVHLLTMGDAPYAARESGGSFTVNSFFIAKNVREIIQEGLGNYTPVFLSDIPRLFRSGQIPLDAALIQVTPPDKDGYVSLGISVDIVKSAAEYSSIVIAQVNPLMPRTLGGSFVHVSKLDAMIHAQEPVIERDMLKLTDTTKKIGRHIAALVEDGSTLELGIGRIPQSVTGALAGKKDLGIHTEMVTDSIVDLVQSGVVTGSCKTIDKGKVVASFAVGTKRLYDFVDNNPAFEFHPTEYVNDPALISSHHKMTAINMALQVDLTGQVCADSIGSKFFSGIGGQVDFNRGAARSEGGKAIIALPSTAKNEEVSRIVCHLTPGAGVVTTRGDVHYVVTEYGVAYLHGKSIQERAIALICIAHPDYRAQLLREAVEAKYLRPEKAEVEGRIVISPPEYSATMELDGGVIIKFRSIRPTDETGEKDMLYALSKETVYYRFMSYLNSFPYRQIQNFVYIDNTKEAAIVALAPGARGEEIVAVGRYYLDPETGKAEVAFVVRDQWQGKGIGVFLFNQLTAIAKRNGISGFTAETLAENAHMRSVFERSGLNVKSRTSEGVRSFVIDFG